MSLIPLRFAFMWILPTMSLSAFGLYFVSRRLGLVLSWLILNASFIILILLKIPACKPVNGVTLSVYSCLYVRFVIVIYGCI
jgi:hypothetical protein